MKRKFEIFFRAQVIVLAALLLWSVWTGAQTNTRASTRNPNQSRAAAAETSGPSKAGEVFRVMQAEMTFGLDKIEILNSTRAFGIPLWQYKVVSFVIFLNIGLGVFAWPDLITRILDKGLKIVIAATVTYTVLKLIDLVMGYWRQRSVIEADRAFDEQLYPIIRKSLKMFVVVVAVLLTSQNLGFNITAALAGLSVGGLALGLAAQDTVANLFGAVAIFIDKPFRMGDRITLENIDGVVETIGLRSTRIRNLDGHLITVPNKTMGNATITNITLRPNIKTVMNIGIPYDTSADQVKRALHILEETYRGHSMTYDVWISFNKFADSSLNILVIHWWNSTDYKAYLAGMQDMNLAIKKRFDQERIGFAFPTQTLYVKQDSEWRFNGALANASAR